MISPKESEPRVEEQSEKGFSQLPILFSVIVPARNAGLSMEARDVTGLRDAMLRCLRDPSFARELGRKGEEHVRSSFSADGMARSYLDVYRQVLGENETNPATSPQEA